MEQSTLSGDLPVRYVVVITRGYPWYPLSIYGLGLGNSAQFLSCHDALGRSMPVRQVPRGRCVFFVRRNGDIEKISIKIPII